MKQQFIFLLLLSASGQPRGGNEYSELFLGVEVGRKPAPG